MHIPNSVIVIKRCAFYNTPQLETTIPEYVTTIELRAFYDSGLSGDLYLPNLSGVIDKESTFQNTKITSISNLGTITEVGGWYGSNRGAFRDCTLLETVVLPNTLKKIGDGPFYGCTALRECNIPSSVTYIGPSAFYNCTSLEIEDLSLPNLETLGLSAFKGVKIKKVSNLGKITSIPQHTNDSCPGTFGDPNWLEELILPDTLVSIGSRGLMKYTALKFLDIPSSVTSIGTNACHSCSGLEYIVVRNETPPSYSSGALTNTNNCPIYVPDASVNDYKTASGWVDYADRIYPMSLYELGGIDNVISFEDPAVEEIIVANCDTDGNGLITKNEVEAVTTISTWFKGNTAIEHFDEFERFTGVTFLGTSTNQESSGAFYGCTSLQSIKLPPSVTLLRPGAFSGCSSLTNAGDLSHVITIGNYAFKNTALGGIARLDRCTEIGWGAFYNSQLTEVYAPIVQTIVAGNTNFNSTSYGAFANCKNLKKVVIGDTCTIINPYAFYGCEGLEECTLPSGLVTLSWNTFQNCTKWKGVVNLPNLETLGRTAFMGSGVEKVENLGKITRLESFTNAGTFQNCKGLLSATLPETLTFLGRQTFQGCNALTRVDMGTGIAEIEYMAFKDCTSLEIEDLSLPNLTTLGQDAFYGVKIKKISNLGKITALPAASASTQNFGDKSVLEEVVLPDTVTSIPDQSFAGYVSLLSMIGIDKVTSLGGGSLGGCSSIKELLLNSVVTLGDSAIIKMTGLRKLVLGENCTTISQYNFWQMTTNSIELISMATTPPSLAGSNNMTFCSAIYVPDASVTAYREAENWNAYDDRIYPMSEYGVVREYENITSNYTLETGQAYGQVGGSIQFTTDAYYQHTKAAISDVSYVMVNAPSQASSLVQYVDENDKILKIAVTNYPSSLTKYNIINIEGATHVYITSATGTMQIWKEKENNA